MKTWWITAYTWRRAAPLLCLAAGTLFVLAYYGLPQPPDSPDQAVTAAAPSPVWPHPPAHAPADWQVLQADAAAANEIPAEETARRFRLAGTYFHFSEEGRLRKRTAYIEDTEKKQQYMLRENDTADGLTLIHIYSNSVAVVHHGERVTLRLSYQGQPQDPPSTPPVQPEGIKTYDDIPALETNRFGKRIGKDRWVFKREALLNYQAELAEDAERLAQLFVSFRPSGNEQEVTGYQLNIRGEQDFFSQIGLQENDVIREVNSMRMVSQKRAELFIREFARNNLNMLVLDIDRDGDEKKLIYLIR